MMRAPTTGIHSVPIFGSLYESCRFAVKNDLYERIQEAALVPAVVGSVTQGTRDRDHVLLSVTAVIKGTPVRALVDSGATRSLMWGMAPHWIDTCMRDVQETRMKIT